VTMPADPVIVNHSDMPVLGTLPGDSLLHEQERFDTWFLTSSAWEQR
jgi:hypothetical protein